MAGVAEGPREIEDSTYIADALLRSEETVADVSCPMALRHIFVSVHHILEQVR